MTNDNGIIIWFLGKINKSRKLHNSLASAWRGLIPEFFYPFNYTAILMKNKVLFLTLFFFAFPIFGYCGDYFVITHTFKKQQEAQKKAAIVGGWVLSTSFYTKLAPNLFAVVRGPFKTKINAQKTLSTQDKGSYLKYAGEIDLNKGLSAANISPQILVALLGELNVSVIKQKITYHPCEPQEPYFDIGVNFYGVTEETDTFEPEERFVDFGGFWSIVSSGEIDRQRICAE